MIKIDLVRPIVMYKQIKGISLLTKVSEENLQKLVTCIKYIVTEDANGLSKRHIIDEVEASRSGIDKKLLLTGSEAVVWLLNDMSISEKVISSIEIPSDVFLEGMRQWNDICSLCVAVEMKNNRTKNLIEIGAPDIVIRNEYRMLTEAVNMLEDTSWSNDPPVWPDGTIKRCLADVGYSLINGWDAGMIVEFKKRRENASYGYFEMFDEMLDVPNPTEAELQAIKTSPDAYAHSEYKEA